jgi:hypothetical protein
MISDVNAKISREFNRFMEEYKNAWSRYCWPKVIPDKPTHTHQTSTWDLCYVLYSWSLWLQPLHYLLRVSYKQHYTPEIIDFNSIHLYYLFYINLNLYTVF